MSEEEWREQLLDLTGQLYEDQFAFIVFGEKQPNDEQSALCEVNAVGTVIMPDCCTPEMLVSAIADLMTQEQGVREILMAAVDRYKNMNQPPQICLN